MHTNSDRKQAKTDLIKFLRHQMMAMSLAEKKKVDGIVEQYPDITVKELLDYWVELVYGNS